MWLLIVDARYRTPLTFVCPAFFFNLQLSDKPSKLCLTRSVRGSDDNSGVTLHFVIIAL